MFSCHGKKTKEKLTIPDLFSGRVWRNHEGLETVRSYSHNWKYRHVLIYERILDMIDVNCLPNDLLFKAL